MTDLLPPVVLLGHNDTPIWGMSAAERVRRMTAQAKLPLADEMPTHGPVLLVNLAYAFDPAWLNFIASRSDCVLTLGGRPVLANVGDVAAAGALVHAIETDAPVSPQPGLAMLAVEQGIDVHNAELRKREQPFLLPLKPDTVPAIERASYYGAYKGVTDLLTKYLWPELALHLTRAAARLGMTPNLVTAIGAAFCVAATFAFLDGRYWLGLGLGFVFMVLDTVDGKLARTTITSSWWGNIFDHGIDLVHPPFWWWAWAVGLTVYGLPLDRETNMLVLATIIGGYVLGRVIEGIFLGRFGMHIHVWRRIDSQFRLITARRNPNIVLLVVAMIFARPDLGLIAVAWWTVISLLFHLVRLGQAFVARAQGRPIISWLS